MSMVSALFACGVSCCSCLATLLVAKPSRSIQPLRPNPAFNTDAPPKSAAPRRLTLAPQEAAMQFHRYRELGMCAALVIAATSAMAQRESDPLTPIVRCVRGGQFNVLEQGRLPPAVSSRSVETLSGAKNVTMSDGYRLILATSQGQPFVNLKVELSVPSSAAADREAVEGQMKAFSSRRAPDQNELQRTSVAEVEVLALHQPDLDRRGPLGFYSMFVPAKSIIATLYILNQEPGRRAFSTYGEYETLREEAANLVRACLAPGGA